MKGVCKIKSLRIELELIREGREDCGEKRVETLTDRRREEGEREERETKEHEVWDGEKVQ